MKKGYVNSNKRARVFGLNGESFSNMIIKTAKGQHHEKNRFTIGSICFTCFWGGQIISIV